MICPRCKSECDESFRFCMKCGYELKARPLVEEEPQPSGSAFENAPRVVVCPHCKKLSTADMSFCSHCGSRLVASPEPDPYILPNMDYSSVDPVRKAEPQTRWPLAAGLLLLGSLLLSLIGLFLPTIQFHLELRWFRFEDWLSIISYTLTLAASIVFLTPTKSKPYIAGIVRLLFVILTAISSVINVFRVFSTAGVPWNPSIFFNSFFSSIDIALTVIFFIGTVIKSKRAFISKMHLIFAIILAVIQIVFFISYAVEVLSSSNHDIFALYLCSYACRVLSGIAISVGYTVAIFSLHPVKKSVL